jgi:hypothetical protein
VCRVGWLEQLTARSASHPLDHRRHLSTLLQRGRAMLAKHEREELRSRALWPDNIMLLRSLQGNPVGGPLPAPRSRLERLPGEAAPAGAAEQR